MPTEADMAADAFDKRRRAEKWLAALNFLVTSLNLVLLPCSAFIWWFCWSMSDAADHWLKEADAFFLVVSSGG
jgi:hypothetical protein